MAHLMFGPASREKQEHRVLDRWRHGRAWFVGNSVAPFPFLRCRQLDTLNLAPRQNTSHRMGAFVVGVGNQLARDRPPESLEAVRITWGNIDYYHQTNPSFFR